MQYRGDMCGRMGRVQEHERVERHFAVDWTPHASPSYNIAPQSIQPVIIQGGEVREVRTMRWGLVPSWARQPDIGFSTFNARAEDITSKPAFRDSVVSRRCLVPADFFYEWRKIGKSKEPFAIAMKDRSMFAFAGVWDTWRQANAFLESFAVITCPANELMADIHTRMPVIIHPDDYQRWLSAFPPPTDLLKPFPSELLEAWPVNSKVGNVLHDDASLIEREEPLSLFG